MYVTFVNSILQKVHNYTRAKRYRYLAFGVTGIQLIYGFIYLCVETDHMYVCIQNICVKCCLHANNYKPDDGRSLHTHCTLLLVLLMSCKRTQFSDVTAASIFRVEVTLKMGTEY
jgi:hypothetical protein